MEAEDPQSRYAVGSETWRPLVPTPSRRHGSDYEDSDIGLAATFPQSPSGNYYGDEFSFDGEGGGGKDDLGEDGEGRQEGLKDCCRRYLDPRRLKYYFPICTWLPRYKIFDLPMDLLAGLAVAMLLIPQGIAYAIIAGLPPNYGLYAGVTPLIMYVIFGTCPQLAVGPEGVISLLLHEVVVQVRDKECGGGICSDEESTGTIIDEYIWALSFMCGGMCLLLGLVRSGFFSNLLSKPILNGFISASGLIIMGSQFDQLFGFCVDEDTCDPICTEMAPEGIQVYIEVIEKFSHGCTNWWALLIGLSSIFLFLGLEFLKSSLNGKVRFISLLPSTFIVIIAGILVGYFTDLQGLRLLGEVKSGAPPPSLPNLFILDRFQLLLPHAVILVLVGFVEATAVAKAYSSKHHYSVSPNRELIAFGSCNLIGSFFSSYCVFSSLPRSRVADLAGARTTLAGLVAALITLLCSLFFMDYFQYLPYSCVSGVIICAAAMLIEIHDIQALVVLKAWLEFCLALVVFIITFVLGPSFGITSAVLISGFLIVRRSTSLELVMLNPSGGQLEGDKVYHRKLDDGIIIIRIDEPLHFGNSVQLKEIIRRIEVFGAPHIHPSADPHLSPLRGLIVHMKNATTIDAESVSVFREIIKEFSGRGIFVHFVRLQKQPNEYLRRGRIVGDWGLLGDDCVFVSLSQSVKSMRSKVERKIIEEVDIEDMNDVPFADYSDLENPDEKRRLSQFERNHLHFGKESLRGSHKLDQQQGEQQQQQQQQQQSQSQTQSGSQGGTSDGGSSIPLPREEDSPGRFPSSNVDNDEEDDEEDKMFDRNAVVMSFSNDDTVKKVSFRE